MRWDYIGNRRDNRLIGEVHLPRISGVYTRGDKARASLITTNSPRLITLLARFTVPWSRIENRALSLSLAGYPPLLLFLPPAPLLCRRAIEIEPSLSFVLFNERYSRTQISSCRVSLMMISPLLPLPFLVWIEFFEIVISCLINFVKFDRWKNIEAKYRVFRCKRIRGERREGFLKGTRNFVPPAGCVIW